MKYVFFALLFLASHCFAQIDTLKYDGMAGSNQGEVLAITQFPGEDDVIFNTRFSPTEKCSLLGVQVAFSLVKFQLSSGNDTLVVYVYENTSVPPRLMNLGKTYRVSLGSSGFPYPNINPNNPLNTIDRDTMSVFFDPPIIFSPKRDFLIGMKVVSKQSMAVGAGTWNGSTILMKAYMPEFQRYTRYTLRDGGATGLSQLSTMGASSALWMRAFVKYDAKLNPDIPTESEEPAAAVDLRLSQNYPNPFSSLTRLTYSVPSDGYVTLTIFDAMGREVARLVDGNTGAGVHGVDLNAARFALSPGIYTARLTSGNILRTKQLLLMK